MANRKPTEELLLNYINKIAGKDNYNLYKELFNKLSDKEFDTLMSNLRDNKTTLSIIVPNGSKTNISIENNYKIAKELGYNFFQHLEIEGDPDIPNYTTPNKYIVLKLPIKRLAQLLSKKISIPEDNKTLDLLTGQVTGKSKGSKLTFPEVQVLNGLGLKDTIKELVKLRGGDIGSMNAMNMMIYKTGVVDINSTERFSTEVESTKTLRNYFLGMQINTTL